MILVKQCNAIQLAHLYEHLFCMAVQDFFYSEQLFPYLDYDLKAHTLHKGIVYVNLTPYTEEAKLVAERIPSLNINLDKGTLMIAAMQIAAEKEKPVGSRSLDELRDALTMLHEKPWQDIDDLDSIDMRNVRRRVGAFFIAKGSPKPTRRLAASVSLDPEFAASHRELLPLFFELASLISWSFQAELAAEYGLYGTSINTKTTAREISLSHVFKVVHGAKLDLEDVLDAMGGSVSALNHHGGFRRFVADLRQASHNKHGHNLPGVEVVLKDTGILIGAKGWHKIATDENCDLILSHMKVTVSTGRQRSSIKVSSVLGL